MGDACWLEDAPGKTEDGEGESIVCAADDNISFVGGTEPGSNDVCELSGVRASP